MHSIRRLLQKNRECKVCPDLLFALKNRIVFLHLTAQFSRKLIERSELFVVYIFFYGGVKLLFAALLIAEMI